jgi:hypothetical protein
MPLQWPAKLVIHLQTKSCHNQRPVSSTPLLYEKIPLYARSYSNTHVGHQFHGLPPFIHLAQYFQTPSHPYMHLPFRSTFFYAAVRQSWSLWTFRVIPGSSVAGPVEVPCSQSAPGTAAKDHHVHVPAKRPCNSVRGAQKYSERLFRRPSPTSSWLTSPTAVPSPSVPATLR